MLEIVCAVYPEAKALIHHLSLKKSSMIPGCDSFVDKKEKIRLTLTGVGKINAASAVSMLLNQSEDPYLLSFGSAFGFQKGLFLADKISDVDTGSSYYPDLILSCSVQETSFLTGSRILSSLEGQDVQRCIKEEHVIYDMESSAIFQAASRFIGPHQMSFVRFVSDHDAKDADAESVALMAEDAYPQVKDLIDRIMSLQDPSQAQAEADPVTELFCEKIHASHTMKNQIDQIVRYAKTINADHRAVMQDLMEREVFSKEEGKKIFDEFQKRICE